MVVLGESTVEGGGWLESDSERWADVLVDLINRSQDSSIDYINKGIGVNKVTDMKERWRDDALYHKLEGKRSALAQGPRVVRIGDCYGPGTIAAAVWSGHRMARAPFEEIGDVAPYAIERVELAAL